MPTILLEGNLEIVAGEMKNTMGVENVREFLIDLRRFTHFFPRYADYRIYGAVAALEFAEGADRFATYHAYTNLTGDAQVVITVQGVAVDWRAWLHPSSIAWAKALSFMSLRIDKA